MLAYAFVYFYLQKQHQKTSIFSIKKNLILISALCPRPVHRGSWCLTLFRVSENVSMLLMLTEGNIGKQVTMLL